MDMQFPQCISYEKARGIVSRQNLQKAKLVHFVVRSLEGWEQAFQTFQQKVVWRKWKHLDVTFNKQKSKSMSVILAISNFASPWKQLKLSMYTCNTKMIIWISRIFRIFTKTKDHSGHSSIHSYPISTICDNLCRFILRLAYIGLSVL